MNYAAISLLFVLASFQTAEARQTTGHNASVFCDRVTATGGMNCGSMVFAHRTLPLGSVHRVSCNGRVVTARVVDRGPAAWTGRSFDLSPGLARACRINGLGHVHLV
jgi:rare lipoprotein A (peptidoglycan hydrolase)